MSTYTNLDPSIREMVIKSYLFKELLYAIKKKRLIKVAINKEVLNLLPLELSRDKVTRYNLLRTSNKGEEYIYKIKEIELLKVL